MTDERTDIHKQLEQMKKQIEQMKEQISNATVVAQSASMLASICVDIITKLEREHENVPTTPKLPDSNGFWRDKDGDIWAYDGDPDNPPRYTFSTANWEALEDYAPFTKISNPFTTGKNNAD